MKEEKLKEEKKLLSWFLGPKSENASFLEESVLMVLREYLHWRRNYFPGDNILITRQSQRELESNYDAIYQRIFELMAKLRRNFPFYSPRYIAHMLSDTSMPSIIGYMAGMLFNPNNVTPEAAPITVEMEIEACNELLQMLGFNPPPVVPKELDAHSLENYKKKLESQFGWGHLTIGGTVANLEALWVARNIKYAPLAIWEIAKNESLSIEVKFPNGNSSDIKAIEKNQLLHLKANEVIYLLARYVNAYRMKKGILINQAGNEAYELLKKSSYHLSHGIGKLYQEFPPVIFVSGTAHYSLHKAADLLGFGRGNIQFVNMNSSFRMDVNDLEKRMNHILADNKIPLAVIPIVGTTEEGAVDPVHEIIDLRKKFEKEQNLSFWVHVDAAWGGYFRSLFNLSPEEEIKAILEKASLNIKDMKFTTIQTWHHDFFQYVDEKFNKNYPEPPKSDAQPINIQKKEDTENKKKKILIKKLRLESFLEKNNLEEYIETMKKLVFENSFLDLKKDNFELTLNDRIKLLNDYISDIIPLHYDGYRNKINFKWGSKEVCSAFVAMANADSITIDPHKMGYINYPCGMVAFRNDRIRHFILQKAPYITSIRQDILVHMPPRHIDENSNKVVTEAFAPFILEGSRPGAAASSLWLTVKTIPPTMRESGLIIKSSLIASRELYEWLIHWDKIMSFNRQDPDYQFIPLTLFPPDTNVVIFGIRRKASNSLIKMNELTKKVYEAFTIQSELGENQYSYGQAFFLSKTEFQEPAYPFENTLKPLFNKYFPDHLDRVYNEYKKEGLVVLRATLMNPYIWMMRNMSNQNFIKEFIQELSKVAEKSSREL